MKQMAGLAGLVLAVHIWIGMAIYAFNHPSVQSVGALVAVIALRYRRWIFFYIRRWIGRMFRFLFRQATGSWKKSRTVAQGGQ
ncbi:hypothetical protein ACTU44_21815 (plasmid) [Thalassospira sp. SM2505]